MALVCCSKDTVLHKKLFSQFGEKDIVLLPDIDHLPQANIKDSKVLIVDLKYSTMKEGFRSPLPIIILTAIPDFQECALLLQRGISGYGNRQMREENIAQAVQSAMAGQIWLPPDIMAELIARAGNSTTQQENTLLDGLTERESEVARYVAKGMSNQEIADKMFVSLRTVKAHLSSIYEKTGLRNRLELGLRLKGNG